MGSELLSRDAGDGVRVLTLSNPARKNAIDDALFDALLEALERSDSVRAWLLRGDGDGVFSSGYDLSALKGYSPSERLPDDRLRLVCDALAAHPAPSVALVNGPAFGAGCELALACDFRVGDPRAVFCMPPTRLGVVYALGGMARVIERVGEGSARYLFLTGRRLAAGEAVRRGLLDVLSTSEDVEREALALCRELAAGAPLAVRGMRVGLTLLARGGGTAEERTQYEALRRESFNSDDAREGVTAILEKRAPRFVGK